MNEAIFGLCEETTIYSHVRVESSDEDERYLCARPRDIGLHIDTMSHARAKVIMDICTKEQGSR
jgi:hypothetical protein